MSGDALPQSSDVVLRRFGLVLHSRTLVIEWKNVSTGKLFHRRVDFNNSILPTTDTVDLAKKVLEANQDVLPQSSSSLNQIASLVGRFVANPPSKDTPGDCETTLLPADVGCRDETLQYPLELAVDTQLEAPKSLCPAWCERVSINKSVFIRDNNGKLQDFYELEQQGLGQGAFGTVQKAKNKMTGRDCAVKAIAKASVQLDCGRCREIELMKEMDHPNLIKLYEAFQDHRSVYIVLELCTGGELFSHIRRMKHLTEDDAACVMQQLLRAVHHLHRCRICHRDLKPRNLLLQTAEPLKHATLKVIDFGASCRFEPGVMLSSMVGTPWFIAPEVLHGSYNELCDVWSCGVIMFLLLSGVYPFHGQCKSQLFSTIMRGTFTFNPKHWDCVTKDAKDLISMKLILDLPDRFSAEEALNHDWIKKQCPQGNGAPLHDALIKNIGDFQDMNCLKKSALYAIAGQLDEAQIRDLRSVFEQLDTNQDGFLSAAEYGEGLAAAGLSSIAPDLQRMIDAIDMNCNDVIDYAEFVASALDAKHYFQEDVCWAAFQAFDHNGNGRICASELAHVLQSGTLQEAMGTTVREVMNQVDTNGDGEIDFEEFMEMMRSELACRGSQGGEKVAQNNTENKQLSPT